MDNDIVYIDLNNWMRGSDYPDEEPFISWLGNDLNLKFDNEQWVKENKLCVKTHLVDMSISFLITAKLDWVIKNCPNILEERNKKFIAKPDDDGNILNKFGEDFLEYSEKNIGITFVEW